MAHLCLTGSVFLLEMVIGPASAVLIDVGGDYSGTVTGGLLWMLLTDPEVSVVEGRTPGVKSSIPGWNRVWQLET